MIDHHIDREWFTRALIEGNLSHWLAATPTPSGFFRAKLVRQWSPAADQQATLVSQCRLLFVMATGYEVTKDPAYLQALTRGADFLLKHLHDAEHGGWFWSCTPDGRVVEAYKSSYGQAFVIFGLSHAFRVTRDDRLRLAAMETWQTVKDKLRDQHGGLRLQTASDFTDDTGQRSQNPMMHTFESLLALHEATGSTKVLADAGELLAFMFTRMYQADGGYLPEAYDHLWRPLPEQAGGHCDVGHQFEWAFLLSQAANRGLGGHYVDIARRLIDFGMRHGYDREHGGIFGRCSYEGVLAGRTKGWWQQAEALRAMMHHAATRGRDDLWPAFAKSLSFVQRHFIDAEFGGWYESVEWDQPDVRSNTDKGSVWNVGYHVTGMYLEALRLCGALP